MRRIINKLRHLLAQTSLLFSYLFVMRQTLDQKVQRLIGDKCAAGDPLTHDEEHSLPEKSKYSWGVRQSKLCTNPCNSKLIVWYAFVLAAIIYWYVEMSILVIFGQVAWTSELQSLPMLIIDVVAIIIFIVDIGLQFNIGYISRGAIIVQRSKVVSRYTHYYVYVDVILVIIQLVALISQNYYLNFAKLLVVFKFARMFEMDLVVMRKLSMSTRQSIRVLYIIFKQCLTIFLLSHTIGVIFYIIDLTLVNLPTCLQNTSLCWLNSATAYSPIISYDWQIQYFYSFYWGVNTITNISYGDIAGNNPLQMIYVLFSMCLGFLTFAYITNKIIGAIIASTQLRDQHRITLVQFDAYMDHLGISRRAQLSTVDFLKYRHWEEKSRDLQMEELMTNKLPTELKLQLIENAYPKVCNGLEFFLGQQGRLSTLLQHLKQKNFGINEVVLSQGEPVNFLLYLHKGNIKISCHFLNNSLDLAETRMPDQFLAAYEFFGNQRSQTKLLSKGNSVLYFVPKQAFLNKAENDIGFKQSLHLIWYELKIKKNLSRIFYKCLRCSKSHHWHQCNQLFPTFQDLELQNRPINNYEVVRRNRPEHKTWKDVAKLKQLRNILKRNRDDVLMRLNNRVLLMQKMLRERREMLEVDCVYDWSNYLTDDNLKQLKTKWNKKRSNSVINLQRLP